ncbi:MAG: TIGR03620 family F420-dependent LLM class oxidoreductase [Gaiellaceae bacterium]
MGELMDIGRVGVAQMGFVTDPATVVRGAARELEELGYGALWYPESLVAKECFAAGTLLLAATERVPVATGIANVWARDAMTMACGARTLEEAFPGRFLLGLGVSHAEQVGPHGFDYTKPVSTMRNYLDRMEALNYVGPEPAGPVQLMLAALRPKMLELARDRTIGAHPYFVPVEHTRRAREILGEGRLLATKQTVILETDADAARELARSFTPFYLGKTNYSKALTWLGYSENDVAGAGSDRLIDDVIAWGDTDAIASRFEAHLDAGADHVCVHVLAEPGRFPMEELRALAPSLLAL